MPGRSVVFKTVTLQVGGDVVDRYGQCSACRAVNVTLTAAYICEACSQLQSQSKPDQASHERSSKLPRDRGTENQLKALLPTKKALPI